MSNWLQNQREINTPPLYYGIQKYNTKTTIDNSKLIIYNIILTTSVFKDDIRKVANILTPLIMDTNAFKWGGKKII